MNINQTGSTRSMLESNTEQRVNIKFLTKLNKIGTESFQMLKEVYDDECILQAHVFKQHKWFWSRRGDVENNDRSGYPVRSLTNTNLEKIDNII